MRSQHSAPKPTDQGESQPHIILEEGVMESLDLGFAVYHELSDQPVSMMDPWQELKANMETLQDLQSRMSFTLREIRYLLKVNTGA